MSKKKKIIRPPKQRGTTPTMPTPSSSPTPLDRPVATIEDTPKIEATTPKEQLLDAVMREDLKPGVTPGIEFGSAYTGELVWGQLPQSKGTHIDAYKQLDGKRPLLLLPVRIETVYHPRGSDNPTELRIRIFPDDLHSDDLERDLTEAEQQDGKAFWQFWWRAAGDATREQAAWDGLLAVHGPLRGSWIARSLRPTNDLATWPKTPLAEHAPLVPAPVFPQVKTATKARAGRSKALPTRFCAVGYDGTGSSRVLQFGNPVPAILHTTINPAELAAPADGVPLVNQKAAWLVDYAQALANGMAITIDLTVAQHAWAKQGVAQLFVFGVNQQLDPAAAVPGVLDELFTAQLYTRGLEVIAPGTATNNTEDVESTWSARPSDDAERLTREIRRMLGRDTLQTDAEDAGSLLVEALGITGVDLIHRLPNARRLDSKDAQHMNAALWPTCLGLLLNTLTDSETSQLLPEATVDWVSEWCAKHVRGSGPLPTLGMGAQPYGLLPVMWQSTLAMWPTKLSTEQFRRFSLTDVLWRARSWWTGDLWLVPRVGITPDTMAFKTVADVDGDGIDDSLLSILARQPHPVRFSQRKLRQRKYKGTNAGLSSYGLAGAHVWWQWWIHLAVEGHEDYAGWDAILGGQGLPTSGLSDELARVRATQGFSNVEQQLEAWRALRGALLSRSRELAQDADRYGRNTAKGAACAEISTAMTAAESVIENPIAALEAHAERLSILRSLSPFGVGSVLNEDGPALGYGVFDEAASDPGVPLVAVTNAQGQAIAPRDWLSWLATRCNVEQVKLIAGATPPSLATLATPPLLFTLLRAAMLRVRYSASKLAVLHDAISHLAKLDAETLTRVAAETLGINGYRYDAWVTSLATERLGRMRNVAPKGATLGAFGWVFDLAPDKRASDSKGFIHAPSLQQAVTAAVLRSGYLAHAQDPNEDAAPLAVNLSSARVRLAKWLLDGIRQGQALGDLLGYRLERQLHDAGLDRFIDDLRAAATSVATELGLPTPARTVADGLVLVEHRSHRAVQTVVDTAAGTRADRESERGRLEAALDTLEAALDATADAVIAQGVHSALIGDDAGGAASFAALSADEAAPPALEVVKTLRSATSLTHRLLIAWDAAEAKSSWTGANKHPWSVACTGLESWVASVLGDPSRYGVSVDVRDAVSGEVLAQERVSVSAAGWSALEFLRLAPPAEGHAPLELERRLASVAAVARHLKSGRKLEFHWDVATQDKLPASDLLLLVRSVRQLLQHSQPLTPADLAVAGAEVADTLASETLRSIVDTQQNTLALAVTNLRTALLGSRASVEAQLKVLATFAVPGAIAAWDASDAEVQAIGRACLHAAERRLAQAQAAADPSERLQALLDTRLPVPVPFVVPDGPALTRNFERGTDRIKATLANQPAHGALEGWLQQVAKVYPGASTLAEVLNLGEALADARLAALELAQLPDPADHVEPWVGRAVPPHGKAPRLSLVTWRHAGLRWSTGSSGATVAGLRVEQWNETVPSARQITGVGVHFDAPRSRAPQSILLMVPPDTVEWSWDLVVETLRQVVELAKIRGLDNELLHSVGHVLPAIFY